MEINHPGPAEDQEQSFPMGLVYDNYDSDPWESHEEGEEEPKEPFISCPEPISEQPSPGIHRPASTFHSPVLTRDIQPGVSNCKVEQAFCCQLHGFCHSFYEPVREYMELHFLHILEPPSFILISTLGGRLKDAIVLLS
jgi:hypothetical protein